MKPLGWIGIVVLLLGIASFFVAVPQKHHEGIQIGGASIGLETNTSQKLPVYVSCILLVGGIAMVIAGAQGGRS